MDSDDEDNDTSTKITPRTAQSLSASITSSSSIPTIHPQTSGRMSPHATISNTSSSNGRMSPQEKKKPRPPPRGPAPSAAEAVIPPFLSSLSSNNTNNVNRPQPKPPLSARNRYNLCAASSRDTFVFGSERPGYLRPSASSFRTDAGLTPRGPLVPVVVVEDWCLDLTKTYGIKRILTLLNENELAFYNESLIETYAKYFNEVVTLPVGREDTLECVLNALNDAVNAEEPIVIHCSTGQGRTGTILALWMHHAYRLPLPSAVTEVMEHASKHGSVRKPSVEALMQLLLGSNQRVVLPVVVRNNGGSGSGGGGSGTPGATPGGTPRGSSGYFTPLVTQRMDVGISSGSVHIVFLSMGGVIDVDYGCADGSAGGDGEGAVGRIVRDLPNANFTYNVVSVSNKPSITEVDKQRLLDAINDSEKTKFVVTVCMDAVVDLVGFLEDKVRSGNCVVLTGCTRPERFRNSDAQFNIGVAVGAVNVLYSGVYICASGRVIEGRASKEELLGL